MQEQLPICIRAIKYYYYKHKGKSMNDKAEATKDDLSTLMPDQEVTVGGETFTVRAFRFMEGLKAASYAAPILKDLERFFANDEAEEEPGLEDLGKIFGDHAEAFMALISLATGQSVAWLEKLDDMEGQLLLLAFWNVNRGFFTRRLVLGAVAKMQARPLAKVTQPVQTDGEKSPVHS